MAYTHSNKGIVTFSRDPIDPDSTDWVYFSYQEWLRTGETITTHDASISGGTIETDSTSLGTVTDSLGISYTNTYGVEITPSSGSSEVIVTHRVTSTIAGLPDLGRTNIDHTIKIPVRTL
jgi:hypothetical protein